MRRDVLETAARRVVNDLQESGLVRMFDTVIEKQRVTVDKEEGSWIEMSVITDFMVRTSNYQNTEKSILSILGLDELTLPSAWQSQINQKDASFIYGYLTKLRNAVNFIPQFLELIERDHLVANSGSDSGIIVQRIILTDEGDSLSSPERLIELLSAVAQIYRYVAEVEGVKENTIAVVALDSGSEKSFDFLGVAKVMQELKELLQFAYNMITFHRQNVTIKNLQVAGDTLVIVGRINSLKVEGALTGEEASRIKHGLFSGLEKFSSTGAYIPEMMRDVQSPALAMHPQPQLLTGPADSIARDNSSNTSGASFSEQDGRDDIPAPHTEFTPEQIAAAVKLLERSEMAPSSRKRIRKSRSPSK